MVIWSVDYSALYSSISPGWHSSSLQMASSVERRIAFIFPVLRIDKFTVVSPMRSASSLDLIFRFASMTSRLTIMGIGYNVRSCSSCNRRPCLKIAAMKNANTPIIRCRNTMRTASLNSWPEKAKITKNKIGTPRLNK